MVVSACLARLKILGCGVALGWSAIACAPALSSFTPAHVPAKHHVQAEAGFDISVPSNIGDLIDDGVILANGAKNRELTDEERRRLFRDGAALALNPPSPVTHIGLGFVPVDRFEVNGRLTSGAWRLGGRYQFLDLVEHGIDGTLSLGGGRYSYELPLSAQIPLLELSDFSRWQLDSSFLLGMHGNWYRWWAGPRALMSFYGAELTFKQPAAGGFPEEKVLASLDGSATYLGGQLGAAVGYKKVFVGFELTLAKFWTSAELQILDSKSDFDVDSFIVYPGIALMLEL